MLGTSESMMADVGNELQALLADYDAYLDANGALLDGGISTAAAASLDGHVADQPAPADGGDVMTPPDTSTMVDTDPAPAPQSPAPTVDAAHADPAPSTPATDPAPTDPASSNDGVVPMSVGSVVDGGAGENRFDVHGISTNFDDLGRILNFTQGEDMLHFGSGVAASADNFVATTAASYDDALVQAIRLIEGGQADYVAVQVGDDTVVFGDNGADTIDSAVVLANHRVTDVNIFDIG